MSRIHVGQSRSIIEVKQRYGIEEILESVLEEFFPVNQVVPIAQRVENAAPAVAVMPEPVLLDVLSIDEILLQDGERISQILSLLNSDILNRNYNTCFKTYKKHII